MDNILNVIGETPIINVNSIKKISFFGKLEYMNPFGSMKDRAAKYVVQKLLESKKINKNTTIIESSSGNFGIALAYVCNIYNLPFICIVDPNINNTNKTILETMGATIIYATIKDENGSFIKDRLRKVNDYIENHPNTYWINQYDNNLIVESYSSLAIEMLSQCKNIDYVFTPVSTCGTIAGISVTLKEINPNIKIIAVDVDGSKIFDNNTKTIRYLSGMGSAITPNNLKQAIIDDVVFVTEAECIYGCHYLLKQGIFVGASSGGVTIAIDKYKDNLNDKNVVAIFPDRGDRYVKNIFNNNWIEQHYVLTNEQQTIINNYPLFKNIIFLFLNSTKG